MPGAPAAHDPDAVVLRRRDLGFRLLVAAASVLAGMALVGLTWWALRALEFHGGQLVTWWAMVGIDGLVLIGGAWYALRDPGATVTLAHGRIAWTEDGGGTVELAEVERARLVLVRGSAGEAPVSLHLHRRDGSHDVVPLEGHPLAEAERLRGRLAALGVPVDRQWRRDP